MTAYYNENDPKAAAWLRELIFDGQIAWGDVDERSIEDVLPSELAGYTQCHFFAGIGGWSYALRLAGWPDDRAVWTGSCPCQPFSQAGKGEGFADERHLWPAFAWLVAQCAPSVLFGEQVASPAGLAWIDVVLTDLESSNYTCATVDTCAAGVGAPHIRQRLYWMADYGLEGWRQIGSNVARSRSRSRTEGALGVATSIGLPWLGEEPAQQQLRQTSESFWSNAEWINCRDGKSRPVEPGTFPLAHGVPGRVGLLRGYGNAIVPWQAAAFIGAYLDV